MKWQGQIKNLWTAGIFLLLLAFQPAFSVAAPARDTSLRFSFPEAFREDSLTTVIPFTKAGSLIILKARADTVEGNFILDTGAPSLVLNLVYFRHYPVQVIADEEQTSMAGGARMINRTQLKNFALGELQYPFIEADLVDLGHIENSKGIRILGLVGLDLLSRCELVVDYEKQLLFLHRIGRQGKKYKSPHLLNDTSCTILPIEIRQKKIIAETMQNGKKYRFVMDSGAESSIIDSRLPQTFLDQVNITGRMQVRGTGNSVVEALRGDLAQLRIGNFTLENLPVLIANLERTCFSLNGCANGVLGFEFLPLRKIGFNFITRKMYLWK